MAVAKKRILALMHEDLIPPENVRELSPKELAPYKTELDVIDALAELGHEVRPLGLSDDLAPLRDAVDEWKPHLVFNLLEEFRDDTTLDASMVAYLELLNVPYTGCNPRGLSVTRDKVMCKKIVSYHGVNSPRYFTVRRGQEVPSHELEYPLFVKSLTRDASLGISEASVVRSEAKLKERVEYMHDKIESHALVEEFIEGREIYVTVIGHRRLSVLPPWELTHGTMRPDAPRIATRRVKWDIDFQKKYGIGYRKAELDPAMDKEIVAASRTIYQALCMSGYARVDYRLREDGKLFFLEANANPDVERQSEAARAAEAAGMTYLQFVDRLVKVGLRSLED